MAQVPQHLSILKSPAQQLNNAELMNHDTFKLVEADLIGWKADKRKVTINELVNLAESEYIPLPIVEALWIVVSSRKVHEVKIEVPLVLVENQEGLLSSMTLRLLEPTTTSSLSGRWVCRPDALGEFKVLNGFLQSLENARSAVNALDIAHPIWPEDSPLVVQWEFASPPSQGIDGGSAGCIVALGLIELFKGAHLIKPEHRLHNTIRSKKAFPFTHLTASAQIDAAGYLQPVDPEGLAAKEQAEGMRAMSFLVLSRQQTRIVKMAAAATRRDFPCSNLNEALLKVSALLGDEIELRVVHPRRWLKLAAQWLVGPIMLGLIFFFGLLYPTWEWQVRFWDMPSSVHVDFVKKPTDCEFGVQLDSTTDYMWVTRIWPALKKVSLKFALSMGGSYHHPDMRDRVSLAAFGELQGLRTLNLDHSEVAMLQGAENLKNLETFVDIGARVSDLRWIEDMPNLRTAVLDSGFVEHYPKSFPGSLESLILHVPPSETHKSISIKGSGEQLKRLALRGDGLKTIGWSAVVNGGGLFSLTGLKEVILHLEEITDEEFKFNSKNLIESLELARCKNLRYFPLGAFPKLKKLRLLGTRFDRLDVASRHDHLEELEISEDAHLTNLDLSNLPKLRRLLIARTAIQQIKGLKEAQELTELELSGMDDDLHGILSEAASIKHLRLSEIPGLRSFDLSSFSSLESLEITDTGITKLDGLQGAKNLRSLIVRKAPLTEIHGLEELEKLELLDLSETKVISLETLSGLTQLADVNLSKTEVVDFPKLGEHRIVHVEMDETPFQRGKTGSPFYEWKPAQEDAEKSQLVQDSSQGFRGGYGGGGYFQVGYWSATPVSSWYSYSVVSNPVYQWTGDPKKIIGTDGWEIEPETIPAPPRFDVRAIMEKWGINAKVSVGSWGYVSDYTDDKDVVAPFVDPQKAKNTKTKTAP